MRRGGLWLGLRLTFFNIAVSTQIDIYKINDDSPYFKMGTISNVAKHRDDLIY